MTARSALPAGICLGRRADLAETVAVARVVRTGGDASAAVIIARSEAGYSAYVNECPHMGMRLDDLRDRIVSADGTRLVCSVHNAQFAITTGQATRGLSPDCALTPIPIQVTDTGDIVTT